VAPRGALLIGLAFATFGFAPPELAAQISDRFAIPATDEGLPGAGPIRRYDWFQNVWRARRTSFAQRLEADRGAVVFLGDSITQGWGGGLGAAFPGVKVANRGIDGDTSRGIWSAALSGAHPVSAGARADADQPDIARSPADRDRG